MRYDGVPVHVFLTVAGSGFKDVPWIGGRAAGLERLVDLGCSVDRSPSSRLVVTASRCGDLERVRCTNGFVAFQVLNVGEDIVGVERVDDTSAGGVWGRRADPAVVCADAPDPVAPIAARRAAEEAAAEARAWQAERDGADRAGTVRVSVFPTGRGVLPLVGAEVRLTSASTSRSATTRADGVATFLGLPAGQYAVSTVGTDVVLTVRAGGLSNLSLALSQGTDPWASFAWIGGRAHALAMLESHAQAASGVSQAEQCGSDERRRWVGGGEDITITLEGPDVVGVQWSDEAGRGRRWGLVTPPSACVPR